MFKVRTKVLGNPDHGEDPYKVPYGVVNKTITAVDMSELKKKVGEWQVENRIGGGHWCDPIVFEGSKCVGRMSYNARIWSTEGKEII